MLASGWRITPADHIMAETRWPSELVVRSLEIFKSQKKEPRRPNRAFCIVCTFYTLQNMGEGRTMIARRLICGAKETTPEFSQSCVPRGANQLSGIYP